MDRYQDELPRILAHILQGFADSFLLTCRVDEEKILTHKDTLQESRQALLAALDEAHDWVDLLGSIPILVRKLLTAWRGGDNSLLHAAFLFVSVSSVPHLLLDG
jgi:hypothetical protein